MAGTFENCYSLREMGKPLIETNQHLRVPEKYQQALVANVSSSTAIETGAPVKSIVQVLVTADQFATPKSTQGSA